MSDGDKIMRTLRSMLTRRGFEVPDGPNLVDFSVQNATSTTLVVFFNDPSRVGIGMIRDISKRMADIHAVDAILVSEGLTPSASVEMRKLMNDGMFIVNMTPESLKFDICDHKSVPPHRIISESEKHDLIQAFGTTDNFPLICLHDPVSKYFGAHPGDVFEIIRNRPNVGQHIYYRLVTLNEIKKG